MGIRQKCWQRLHNLEIAVHHEYPKDSYYGRLDKGCVTF